MQGIAEARQQEQRALATHLHPGPRLRGAARGHPRLAGGLPPGLRCARVVALTWSGCGSGRGARGARGGLLGACPDCGAPSPRPRRQAPSRRRPHCSGGVAGAAGLGAAGAGEYARPADPRPRAPGHFHASAATRWRARPPLRHPAPRPSPPPLGAWHLPPAPGSAPPPCAPALLGPGGIPQAGLLGLKNGPRHTQGLFVPFPKGCPELWGLPVGTL